MSKDQEATETQSQVEKRAGSQIIRGNGRGMEDKKLVFRRVILNSLWGRIMKKGRLRAANEEATKTIIIQPLTHS